MTKNTHSHLNKALFNFFNLNEVFAPENTVRKVGLIYALYRILVTVFLMLTNNEANEFIELTGISHNLFSSQVEYLTLATYVGIGFLLLLVLFFYPKYIRNQLLFGLFIDILALNLLMYSGTAKDLQTALLFMVIIATSFMMVQSSQAVIITLSTIISLITQQLYYAYSKTAGFLQITDALLLSLSLLAVAFLSWSVSKRLSQVEFLAQKNTEEIKRLNAINREVIKNMVNGVVVVDKKGNLILINETAKRFLRLHLGLPNHNQDHTIYYFELQRQLIQHYQELMDWSQKQTLSNILSLSLPEQQDGITSKLRINKKYLPEYGQLLIIEDVSREESHAQQLKLASLGQLSASIAHEIRNPLGAISGASELLMEESALSSNYELYEMIYHQTKRVNRIIEDVMRLSRQEQPNQEVIPIVLWLKELLAQHYPFEDITLGYDNQQAVVVFDSQHLEQIMLNLLANAIRHSTPTPNEPSVQIHIHDNKSDSVFIDIIDNGIGVADADLAKLFNPFFTKSQGGTGLGLYLSKAFSEANHARLIYLPHHPKTCFRLITPMTDELLD